MVSIIINNSIWQSQLQINLAIASNIAKTASTKTLSGTHSSTKQT